MHTQNHADLAWLIDYAAGTLTPGFKTVIGGHLRSCAHCREELRVAETLGHSLVHEAKPLKPRLSPAAIRAKAVCQPAMQSATEMNLQEYIADSIGFDWHTLPWRAGTPGLRIARVQEDPAERIWLLHANPGTALPEHAHSGAELTLVVRGAYRSDAGAYAAGDIDENDENIIHRPIVTPSGDCICLLVFEGRLKFTGAFGVAQKILKF